VIQAKLVGSFSSFRHYTDCFKLLHNDWAHCIKF